MKDHLDNGMNLKEKLTSLKTSDKALELGKLLSYKEIEAVMKVVSTHTQSKLKAFAEEVEEAVGERKKFNFWNKTSIGMMCEEAYVNGQNNIIDSVSKALKAIKGKYQL
jgi:hypothetical protein